MSDWGDVAKWSASSFRNAIMENVAEAIANNLYMDDYIDEDTDELNKEALVEDIARENDNDMFWGRVGEEIENACIYPRRCETIIKQFGRRGYRDWKEKLEYGEPYQTDFCGIIDTVEKAAAAALYDYVLTNENRIKERANRRAYTIMYFSRYR